MNLLKRIKKAPPEKWTVTGAGLWEMIALLKEEKNGSLCGPSDPLCSLQGYSCLFLSMGFLSEMQMFAGLTWAWMRAERSPHSSPVGIPAVPAACFEPAGTTVAIWPRQSKPL